jgi:hypothetical protein
LWCILTLFDPTTGTARTGVKARAAAAKRKKVGNWKRMVIEISDDI